MNDQQLEQLKQFVVSIVTQSEERMGAQMEAGFAGVGEAIESLGKHIDERLSAEDAKLAKHEHRIVRLENRPV
jgi:hypothetical protein